jgi:hypothetical protein
VNRRRRRLSQQDLRAMGTTPGLMARRYDAAGRARLEQLTSEASGRPPFLRSRSNNCPKPVEEEG